MVKTTGNAKALFVSLLLLTAPQIVLACVWYPHTAITDVEITAPADGAKICASLPSADTEVACSCTEESDTDKRVADTTTYPADCLTYTWSKSRGSWKNGVNTGRNVTWIAPDTPSGSVNGDWIKVTITDAAVIPPGESGDRDDEDETATIYVTVHGGGIYSDAPEGEWLYLKCPASSSPTQCWWVLEQPAGTTYLWEITQGDTKAHIVGSSSNRTVILQGDAASAARLDVHLQVTCTVGGHSCESTCALTVHTPSQAESSQAILGFQSWSGPPLWEMQRNVSYYIRNQFSIALVGAWWDETWSNQVGPGCASIGQGDGSSGAGGLVTDVLYWWQTFAWRGAGFGICQADQTISVDGCPSAGDFWANELTYTEEPMITVTPQ